MSRARKQAKFALFSVPGLSSQSWRHPEVPANGTFSLDYYVQMARTAERGLFDAMFFADSYGVLGPDHLPRYSSATQFEPLSLAAAIAARTEQIGLIYTASTTLNDPFKLARDLASLDHLSGGRAGWNAVTSRDPGLSRHYAVDLPPRDERYARADEFCTVLKGLWDTFEDGAFPRDRAAAQYYDPARQHVLDHAGTFYRVQGPLGIARPVQGHPVIAQAGASDAGRDFAARHAEVIFAANLTADFGRAFSADIKGRAAELGRCAEDIAILSGTSIVWGSSDAEAEDRFAEINALFAEEGHLETMARMLEVDLDRVSPDEPLVEPEGSDSVFGGGGHQRALLDYALRRKLTLRQLARETAATNKHRSLVGSTQTIADDLEEWIETGATDGFVFMSPFLLAGLESFVSHVTPELQRRGLFRTAYEGPTLREKLGLRRPDNQFAAPPIRREFQ